jgi:hypothetical protein
MIKSFLVLSAAAALLLCPGVSSADISIGTSDSSNGFPFNAMYQAPSDRYQQVYAASNFSGVTTITGITFFDSSGQATSFQSADYSFALSTSNFTVDNLDTINLDANPGSDVQPFADEFLSGPITDSFTISGTPFTYDPSRGDLLLDIKRSLVDLTTGSWGLDAMAGDAGGLFSRAQNFGVGTTGWGLVTEFETVPEPSTLTLLALGAVVLVARRRQ